MKNDNKKTRVLIIAAANALFAGSLHEGFDFEIADTPDVFLKGTLPDIKNLDEIMRLSSIWKKACKCDWPCHCESKFKTSNVRNISAQSYKGPLR